MVDSSDSNLARLNDEALMLRFKEGDYKAFEHLFFRYRNLKSYTARRVGDSQAAENIVQEAWLRLIKGKDRYKPTAKFKTYLYTIVEHLIIDEYRSQAKAKNQITDDEEVELQPDTSKSNIRSLDDYAFLRECIEHLQQAITILPTDQKKTLLLKLESRLNLSEIGGITGVARETVKTRLRYARDKLKQLIPEECLQVLP